MLLKIILGPLEGNTTPNTLEDFPHILQPQPEAIQLHVILLY